MTQKRHCTQRDVAQAAGVSDMTVSRVMRGKGTVSARTKEHVLACKGCALPMFVFLHHRPAPLQKHVSFPGVQTQWTRRRAVGPSGSTRVP